MNLPRKGKISGLTLYTAEEYLKMDKYKTTGRLKRELDEIERSRNVVKRPKGEIVKLQEIIKKVLGELNKDDLTVKESKGYHYISGDKLICWLAQRGYGVSLSYKDGSNKVTHRIMNEDDVKVIVDEMRGVHDLLTN